MILGKDLNSQNDVLEILDRSPSTLEPLEGKWVFVVNDFFRVILEQLKKVKIHYLYSGIPARVLVSEKGGWQKGKLYIRFEFVPDPPKTSEESAGL